MSKKDYSIILASSHNKETIMQPERPIELRNRIEVSKKQPIVETVRIPINRPFSSIWMFLFYWVGRRVRPARIGEASALTLVWRGPIVAGAGCNRVQADLEIIPGPV
jgi:hypothetical protein